MAAFVPLTAVTYPKFGLYNHVLCFARIMSTLSELYCRQTARIGGGQLPPVPYAYDLFLWANKQYDYDYRLGP